MATLLRARQIGPALPLHLLLLTVTVVTMAVMWTRLASGEMWLLTPEAWRQALASATLWRGGLTFSAALATILLAHELGHYIMCRLYGLQATLPFFLPAPVGIGTFGAFIRIRSRIDSRATLFDVGASGPLAGLAAALPILWMGFRRSAAAGVGGPGLYLDASGIIAISTEGAHIMFSSPLLFRGLSRALLPSLAGGGAVVLHPFILAGWFGLFATALNLLPLGQLDGGHVAYAILGRWQRFLAWPLLGIMLALGFFFKGWWLWSAIILVMGVRHPRIDGEAEPLSIGRWLLGVALLLVLAACFTPVPAALLE